MGTLRLRLLPRFCHLAAALVVLVAGVMTKAGGVSAAPVDIEGCHKKAIDQYRACRRGGGGHVQCGNEGADGYLRCLGLPNTKLLTGVCPHVRAPQAAIDAALADWILTEGALLPRNPSVPYDAHFNPLRTSLTLRNRGRPWHPAYNSLVLKAGCP